MLHGKTIMIGFVENDMSATIARCLAADRATALVVSWTGEDVAKQVLDHLLIFRSMDVAIFDFPIARLVLPIFKALMTPMGVLSEEPIDSPFRLPISATPDLILATVRRIATPLN